MSDNIILMLTAATIVIMWLLARRRGFNPWCWFLAAGLIGLTVLVVMPRPNQPGIDPSKAEERVRRGNIAGLLLTLMVVVVSVAGYYFIPSEMLP